MAVLTPEQQQSVASRVDFQTTTVSRLKQEIDRERGKPSAPVARPEPPTPSAPTTALALRLQAAEAHAQKCELALAGIPEQTEAEGSQHPRS